MRDAATLLGVMAGKDRHDATSLDADVPDYAQGLEAGVQGLRIGVLAEAFGEGVEPDVAASVHAGVDRLAGLGAEVGEASLPHAEYALSAYYLIAPSEASSNLARYDGVRYGLRVDGDDSIEMMFRTRGAGFGPGKRHHARHVRPLGRLLRGLLRSGPEGAHADPAGLRSLRAVRRARLADVADDRVRSRRPTTRWRCT